MCYLRGEELVAIQAGVAPRVVSIKHEKYTTPTPRCTLYAQRIVVLPNLAETNPIPYPTFLHVWIGQVPGYNNSSCPSGGKAVHMSEPSNELSAAFGLRPRVYVRVCVRRRDITCFPSLLQFENFAVFTIPNVAAGAKPCSCFVSGISNDLWRPSHSVSCLFGRKNVWLSSFLATTDRIYGRSCTLPSPVTAAKAIRLCSGGLETAFL